MSDFKTRALDEAKHSASLLAQPSVVIVLLLLVVLLAFTAAVV